MTLPFPDSVLAQHVILLAKTGAGKSSIMRLIAEHALDHKRPLCIIDPKGDWWGIKSSASGKRAGYPVVIFGGEHADVPINPRAGADVAELVASGNRPALVDISKLTMGERTRFFVDFADSFFRHTRGLRILMMDEVHNFAPQGRTFDVDSAKALHWANRFASEGRGKGITLVSASQRPQKVHKDYVTSHETLIAGRTIHPLDRAQIKDWIDGCPDADKGKQVLDGLAALKRGQAWVWSPEIEFGPKLVTFPLFSTYDSFAPQTTHAKLKGWAAVDLDEVTEKLAAVLDEHKRNDPTELRKQIASLEQKIRDTPGGGDERFAFTATDITEAERRGHDRGTASVNEAWKESNQTWKDSVDEALLSLQKATSVLHASIGQAIDRARMPPSATPVSRPSLTGHLPAPKPRHGIVSSATLRKTGSLTARANLDAQATADAESGSDMKLLGALSYWRALGFANPTKAQAAAVAGWRVTAGHMRNVCGRLRTRGLIEYPTPNTIALTAQGEQVAPPADTSQRPFDRLLTMVNGPQTSVLRVLKQVGRAMTKDGLANTCGWEPTAGHLRNVLGSLRTLQAIKYPEPGKVQLEDWLR